MYWILFVLDNVNLLDKILEAWYSAGITGATIIESTGLHRMMHKKIPLRYALGFPGFTEEGHYTLMSLVPDMKTVKTCLEITETITGDLSNPNTGLFTSWKVELVKGVEKKTTGV